MKEGKFLKSVNWPRFLNFAHVNIDTMHVIHKFFIVKTPQLTHRFLPTWKIIKQTKSMCDTCDHCRCNHHNHRCSRLTNNNTNNHQQKSNSCTILKCKLLSFAVICCVGRRRLQQMSGSKFKFEWLIVNLGERSMWF